MTNRVAVETSMAGKFESFGRIYLANFMREHGTFTPESFLVALGQMHGAAQAVATHFVDRLPTTPAEEPGVLDRIRRALGL